MSTNFPTSLDTLTNPTSTSKVSVVDHAAQHANANDAIEALEAKVGADSSAVTTSHDYKLSGVTSSAKAVSNNSTENIAGVKTFTTSQGIVATRPKFITSIDDTNGNEVVKITATGSAVNEVTFANAATGSNPSITPSGDDSNIGLDINTKGTGTVNIKGNSTQAGAVRIYEDTDDGSNYTEIKVQAQVGNVAYTLPAAQGSANTVLTNNGSGTLTWAAPTASSVLTLVPKPILSESATGAKGHTVTTTASVGLVEFPFSITVNKISINVPVHSANGTLKIGLYTEDGQTQVFNVTTGTITGTGVVTTSLGAPTTVAAGNYYIVVVPTGTSNFQTSTWTAGIEDLTDSVSSEPVTKGELTVTAETLPTTFTPSAISATGGNDTLIFRLDN